MIKRIEIPIFELEVWFCDDKATAAEFIKRHGGDPDIVDDADGISHQWTDKDDKGWRLFGVFDGKPGTVAHEAVHMGIDILEACDVREEKGSNHEVLAFMVGWLVKEALRLFAARNNAQA